MANLVITSYAPARTTGRGLRTCGVISALAAAAPVTVAFVPFAGEAPADDLASDARITLRKIPASRGARRLAAAARALAAGAPPNLAKTAVPELLDVARRAGPDVRIVADGPTAAVTLLPLARERPIAYLAHNLESAFRGTRLLRAFERRLLRTYAETWMPTGLGAEQARRLAGAAVRLRHVPNVVDVDALPPPAARPGHQRALFVADFSYLPNRDALEYLLGEVMPLVWQALPEASLDLVGRGVTTAPADPRVRALGFVEDLDPAYAGADVVVVPLRQGGGSPLKLVEGLARGLPVVTTEHAARLLEVGRSEEDFLAAADAAGFARAVVRVLCGEAPDLGARGRALAARDLSVQALGALLEG